MSVKARAARSYVYLEFSKGSFHTLMNEVNFDTTNLAKDLKLEIEKALDNPQGRASLLANDGQSKHYTVSGVYKDGEKFNLWINASSDEAAITYVRKYYGKRVPEIIRCARGWHHADRQNQ